MTAQDTMDNLNNEISASLKKAQLSSQTEEAISNLLVVLEQAGLINEATKGNLEKRLNEDFYLALMTELLTSFTDENKQALVNAYQSGLNDIQMLELQFELYRKNKGQEIEIFAQKLYDDMAERVLKDLEILRQSVSDVEKLTDDQVRILESLISEKAPEEEVLSKLQSFQNGTPSTTDTQTLPQQEDTNFADIIALIKQGKLEEAREELNKAIYGVR